MHWWKLFMLTTEIIRLHNVFKVSHSSPIKKKKTFLCSIKKLSWIFNNVDFFLCTGRKVLRFSNVQTLKLCKKCNFPAPILTLFFSRKLGELFRSAIRTKWDIEFVLKGNVLGAMLARGTRQNKYLYSGLVKMQHSV